jgi:hypothetical protein
MHALTPHPPGQAPARLDGPERELVRPRAEMRDPHMIAARMVADIDELVAAEGYVTIPQMIRIGWTREQIRAWRAQRGGR